MAADTERTIRIWRAAEMFSPRPLPLPDARENVTDAAPGEPLPWEPGGRLAGRQAASGRTWRHEVFGGLFRLGKVRGTLSGESALFTCIVSESGVLHAGPAVSECAWAVGQLALGEEAAGSGDPSSWLTGSSGAGRLRVARENLPDLPDGPLTAVALSRFAAELAGLLGVTELLEPSGLRVRSYQASSSTGENAAESADAGSEAFPLAGYFAADLARIDDAARASAAGLPLLAFLGAPAEGGDVDRVDVRRRPLTVRDGCAPDRMPPARWPADAPLVLSEQFAVNEILGRSAPLAAVDARPAGTAAVFNDLIAAIVTERARAMAALPSPDAAFGPPLRWGPHSVAPPAPALTGFEILLASPSDPADDVPGLGAAGAGWRDRAAAAAYFAATARLAAGESWAMIRAHLGGMASRRAFAERFWHGRVSGSEVLFSAGMPIRAQLREHQEGGWRAAVDGFRSALADVDFLSSERMMAADALARFSALEQKCEDAHESLETAQALVADLVAREPDAREAAIAAEERRRAALEDLQVHQGDRPGLAVSMSTGLRAGREWHAAHAGLRAAFDAAARSRDAALRSVQELRSNLAAARKTMTDARDAAGRLGAAMDALQGPVAVARKRWGDHVPEGPSYAETEDAALIERREHSAPWSDPAFATARAALFLAALCLHKSLICANARVVEANLAAWTDIASGEQPAGPPPPEVALAAWRSFFLVVPVVSTTYAACGSLLDGLGRGSLGWLLAAGAGSVPPRQVAGALWRVNRAVLAGTSANAAEGEDSALALAARVTRFGTALPDGAWTGLPLYSRPGAPSPVLSPAGDSEMLRAVLSDLRHRARSRRASRSALAVSRRLRGDRTGGPVPRPDRL